MNYVSRFTFHDLCRWLEANLRLGEVGRFRDFDAREPLETWSVIKANPCKAFVPLRGRNVLLVWSRLFTFLDQIALLVI